jgi:hypothetical protein
LFFTSHDPLDFDLYNDNSNFLLYNN